MADVSEVWRRDHPWAVLFDFMSNRERISRPIARLVFGVDVRDLFSGLADLDEVPDGGAVLDIPCGGGTALAGLTPQRKLRYVAADISPAMRARSEAIARARGLDQVEVRAADVEDLPFADGEFDLCLSFAGLHCFPHPDRAVLEIARCLRSGGRLTGTIFLVDTGVRYVALRLAGRGMGVLGPSGGRADLERWLRDAGLEDVRVERLGTMARFSARKP